MGFDVWPLDVCWGFAIPRGVQLRNGVCVLREATKAAVVVDNGVVSTAKTESPTRSAMYGMEGRNPRDAGNDRGPGESSAASYIALSAIKGQT